MRLTTVDHVRAVVRGTAEQFGRDRNARKALAMYDLALAVLRTIPAAAGSRVEAARRAGETECLAYREQALQVMSASGGTQKRGDDV